MDDQTIFSQDPWRILRIVSEFVTGFDKLRELGPSVSFFGSSTSTNRNSKFYLLTEEIAKKLAQNGFGIISGGGRSFMEAANKGAQEGGGKSCGLCIELPNEKPNQYIDSNFLLSYRHFFVRKVMFVKYTRGFIVMPGAFGTLNELTEALSLVHTHVIAQFPIILIGSEYWKGFLDWLKNVVIPFNELRPECLKLLTLTDDPDEVVRIISKHQLEIKHIENF